MPGGHVLADQQGVPVLVDTAPGRETPLTTVTRALAAHPELGGLATHAPYDWTISPDGAWLLTRTMTDRVNVYGGYFPVTTHGKWVAVKLDGSAVLTYQAAFSRDTQAVWHPGQPEWIAVTPTLGAPVAIHYPLAEHGTPKVVTLRSRSSFQEAAAALGMVGSDRIMLAAWYNAAHVEVVDTSSSGITLERYGIRFPPGAMAVEMELSPRGDRIAWLFNFNNFSPLTPLRHALPFLHPGTGQTLGEIWVSDIRGNDMHPLITGSTGSAADMPHYLRWTPDQSQISFVYRDALYTVPAT
jgi:hypothetical protein